MMTFKASLRSRLFFLIFWGIQLSGFHALQAQNYNSGNAFLNRNSYWCFGINAALKFNGNAQAQNCSISTAEGSAAVCSPDGQLLFYSDGGSIWNRNGQKMPHGDSLLGNNLMNAGWQKPFTEEYLNHTTAQGVCIVPVPDSAGKYYVFSLQPQGGYLMTGYSQGRLYYSVVDTALDNGLGDIVTGEKNIMLDSNRLSESMIAVPGNQCDVWLIVHTVDSGYFKAYHITKSGVDPNPVVSHTVRYLEGASTFNLNGTNEAVGAYMLSCMAISPDRSRLAITSSGIGGFPGMPYQTPALLDGALLCRFDPGSGTVSDPVKISNERCLGVCFSPNSRLLYLSYEVTAGANLVQYNVTLPDSAAIAGAAIPILQNDPAASMALRLYRDSVYVNRPGPASSFFLSRINRPDQVGLACGYEVDVIPLQAGTQGLNSLPSEVVAAFPPDTIGTLTLDTLCNESTVVLAATPGFNSYIWSDGSQNATLPVENPGTYWVLCKDDCHSRRDSFVVERHDIRFSLPGDTLFCDAGNMELLLQPGVPDADYLWQDNSRGNSMQVTAPGLYWVRVSRGDCSLTDSITVTAMDLRQDLGEDKVLCRETPFEITLQAKGASAQSAFLWNTGNTEPVITVRDTGLYIVTVSDGPCFGRGQIRISTRPCNCQVNIPNAFTPNGDGINDIFVPVIAMDCPVKNYQLRIFNRYGQMVFSAQQLNKGWDGLQSGQPADGGTYMFELSYEDGSTAKTVYKRGDVLLIR